MPNLFVEVEVHNAAKVGQTVSGDVAAVYRRPEATFVLLADGLKSGVRANLAAEFCLARLRAKLECGASLTAALADLLVTLEENRRRLSLWSAFSVLHFIPNGLAMVYTYEMPPPLALLRRGLHLVPAEHVTIGGAIVGKYRLELRENEGVILLSDGVTQAGVGNGLAWGWGVEGVRREGEFFLASDAWRHLPRFLVQRAQELSSPEQSDDATAILALVRKAHQIVVFTGPPSDPRCDDEIVRRFLSLEGTKIVCGGTTAGIVARVLGTEPIIDPKSIHPYCPPRLILDGVDYATEGAICLNQVYNLLDALPRSVEERNIVVALYEELLRADQITFLVGRAENPAAATQPFFQMGILRRQQIVPLLAEKLRAMGKLVTVEWL
ncbi:MAG: SpoIIE family protein phosphatase [Candidatus Sumerlaeaceae bacterium]|nr:SpoIIE family protein phosphatase [Candidatus Sumerlaeaceae bacterium]